MNAAFSRNFFDFASKVLTNLFTVAIGFLTTYIVPKSLGVIAYGQFSYLTDILTKIFALFDLRSSTFFFVNYSKDTSNRNLIAFYFYYALAIIIGFSAFILIIAISPIKDLLFEELSFNILVLGIAYIVLYWILEIYTKLYDALALTIWFEKIKILARLGSLLLLLTLFFTNVLTLKSFFLYHFTISALPLLLASIKKGSVLFRHIRLKMKPFLIFLYLKKVKAYVSPLFFYLLITMLAAIFDRWILQQFGGSYAQGLYGFSFLLSNIIVLFITSITPLFTRDVAILEGQKNDARMAHLYKRFVPMVYTFIAVICAFTFVNSKIIILAFTNENYLPANTALKVMSLYPLVSTFSNLNGSIIYASGKTRIFRNLSLILSPLGVLLVYVLVSDKFTHGFGATGLAIKVVLIEFLSVLIISYFISRKLNIHYSFLLKTMTLPASALFFIAFIIEFLYSHIVVNDIPLLAELFIKGTIYLIISLMAIYKSPQVFGVDREYMNNFVADFKKK